MTSHIRRIRSGVTLVALSLLAAFAVAQDGAASVSTQSYPLFPVDGGGFTATLQVAESEGGDAELVLSISGLDPNDTYRGAIYEGDCGPDRPLVLELAPTGLGGDPYVSTTETNEVSFEGLTEGDHFVYLFEGDEIDRPEPTGLDGEALACGEVGAGALR